MRLAFGLGALLCAGAMFAACRDGPPEPGFEEVGGEGGAITGTGSSASGATKVTGTGTTATGTSSASATTATTTATATASSTATGTMCNDTGPGEPNDTETTAHDLGTIGDCDDQGGMVAGLLDGAGDPDWYVYLGEDQSFNCLVDPHRAITSSDPIRLCKFFECLGNETNSFTCPLGTTPETSPGGRPGCCGDSEFILDLVCGSSDLDADDAWVYVRVDTTVNACVTYTLSYNY